MVRKIQPCDWQEKDIYPKDGPAQYVIDVYGRSEEEETVRVRITGYKPFFYAKFQNDNEPFKFEGAKMIKTEKYDIWQGFNGFKPSTVFKYEFVTLKAYKDAVKAAKEANNDIDCTNKMILYESNIPPFLRFFHERDIQPASPIIFQPYGGEDPRAEIEDVKCDKTYRSKYIDVKSDPLATAIPLLLAVYDLEVYSDSGNFPLASNPKDEIIQIGVTFRWTNDLMKISHRKVLVLGTVPEHKEMQVCHSEAELIQEFANLIEEENPDIICGYNTFGFDDKYLIDRAKLRKVRVQFGRVRVGFANASNDEYYKSLLEHKVFELASGKYDVNYIKMPGRLSIDLLLNMRREHNLDSYKLDNVANTFLRDKVVEYKDGSIKTKSTRGLCVGNYVRFDLVGNTTDPYRDGEKYVVTAVDAKSFTIKAPVDLFQDLSEKERKSVEWTFTKDDVSAHDIFRMQKEGPEERAIIARYCLQDCDLVATLMSKLDTLVNARGMADVCIVPMQYLFLRGQGIKIYSRIAYEAMKREQIIMTQEAAEGDIGYEGAIVIPPKIGMYLDQPVAVLDYNSLYPSSMIAENLSPDTFVSEKYYSKTGKLEKEIGWKIDKVREFEKQGYKFNKVQYSVNESECHCLFVEPPEGHPLGVGIIPQSLQILLAKRKETRQKAEFRTIFTSDGNSYSGLVSEQEFAYTVKNGKDVKVFEKKLVTKIEDTYDDGQKAVFNGLQLAYKVVANSIYGQCGSRTSPIRKLCVAACTTAVGRRQLTFAKEVVENEFGGQVVYGDTDSIFIKFDNTINNLPKAIELGQKAAEAITSRCKKPLVIGYEKTLFPFILFCRKRYVGMLYEDDPNVKPKRKSMGIVLKRRDNAPVVKDVFGGALDMLLEGKSIGQASDFVQDMMKKVLNNELPIEKYVITKQLRDDYKDPTKIAHRVLADRMTERDPGSAPNVGDRLQFVYIKNDNPYGKKILQGDRIEDLDYVKTNKLEPDAVHYITNQIQNPVAQLFALGIERLPGYKEPKPTYAQLLKKYMEEKELDEEEATLKVLDQKEKQLDTLLFLGSPVLSRIINSKKTGPMDKFFPRKPSS